MKVLAADEIAFRIYPNPRVSGAILHWILDRGEGSEKIYLKTWAMIPSGCSGVTGREDHRNPASGPQEWIEGVGFVEIDEHAAMAIITLR